MFWVLFLKLIIREEVWILFTIQRCFWALKGEKTSYKTAFVSYIESDSCIIAFLKVLSKPSKGRYLDFKRASLASQKGVNWKLIYALFVCSLRILFTKVMLLAKAIENLKDRSVQKSIVFLFLCLQTIQLLFLGLCCLLFHQPTSNLLTCLLVILSTKETFFCYSVFIFPLPFVSLLLCLYFSLSLFFCYPVLILLCLKVV